MITYTLLALDKDTIVALSGAYGLIELPIRLSVLLASNRVIVLAAWPSYLAIVFATTIGFWVGIRIRRMLDSATILRLLLVLVFLSSGILLGMLKDPVAAGGMGIAATTLIAVLCAAWRWPLSFVLPKWQCRLQRMGCLWRGV